MLFHNVNTIFGVLYGIFPPRLQFSLISKVTALYSSFDRLHSIAKMHSFTMPRQQLTIVFGIMDTII